jgi:alpha-amylase
MLLVRLYVCFMFLCLSDFFVCLSSVLFSLFLLSSANHVAPVDLNFQSIIPFNESQYYHSKCQIEDWNNQSQVELCRLANLPDLDQNHPFVRSTLLSWFSSLQEKYNFDGYRVDTIPEVSHEFWKQWQTASPSSSYCVGEVFNGNITYVSSYQQDLDGVLSYPLYYTMKDIFIYQQSMNELEGLLGSDGSYWKQFKDVNLLGTFIDNHDNPRFLNYFSSSSSNITAYTLYKNALVLTLFTAGIPIIYYGSEQGYHGGADPNNRESLWPNYDMNSELYSFLSSYVAVRKQQKVWNFSQIQRFSSNDFYSFSRGNILICLTNSGSKTVSHTLTYLPYSNGQVICNVVNSNDCLTVTNNSLTITLDTGLPKVYVPK